MNCKNQKFSLKIPGGEVRPSEIVVLMGRSGSGKTTFLKTLAGIIKPEGQAIAVPRVSLKPQVMLPKFDGTVQELINSTESWPSWASPVFQREVYKPLNIDELLKDQVKSLSGGQLQRLSLLLCLAKPCEIFLIDELAAHLDCEYKIAASRALRAWIKHTNSFAFVAEHDHVVASYLANKVMCFESIAVNQGTCSSPLGFHEGMNKLQQLLDFPIRKEASLFFSKITKYSTQQDLVFPLASV